MKKIKLLTIFLFASSIVFSQAFLMETFENNQANDWTLEDQWTVGNLGNLWGLAGGNINNTNILGFDDFQAGENHVGGGRAISPLVDLTNASAPLYLEVLIKFRNADQGFPVALNEIFKILVSTDNGITWEEFYDFEIDEPDWEKQIFNFDQYVGQSILVAFDYTDGGGLNIGAAIDDVAISNELVFTQPLDYTLTVDGGSMFSQCAENIDYKITGVVVNNGTENITSFDLLVDSGNEVNTFSFQSNISTENVYRYAISQTINTGISPSSYTVSIMNVNGSVDSDANISDNSWDIDFNPISTVEGKGVLLEEGTGMWCGFCPRGTVFIEEIAKRFGKQVATVAVHNNDLLTNAAYDQAIQNFGVFGYPSVVFNREEIMDPEAIVLPVIEELASPAIADIDLAGTENINDFTATVKVTFNQSAEVVDYNVSVILTEDQLMENSENWNQANSYSQSTIHMGGFEFFTTDAPSSFWPYNHVGRALIGGFEGVNAIIGNYGSGASAEYTFDPYIIPLNWDKDNIKVIAVLTDENDEVVNVISKKYDEVLNADLTTSTADLLDESKINIYPNPINNWLTIDLNTQNISGGQLILRNLLGQSVISQQLTGQQQVQLNLSSLSKGVYILQLEFNNQKITKKITIQ